MSPEQSTLWLSLIASAAAGHLYSRVLESIYLIYFPKYIWITVVFGEALVIATMAVMEIYFNLTLTWLVVTIYNAAWGAPVIYWQVWQQHQREQQEHALEGE